MAGGGLIETGIPLKETRGGRGGGGVGLTELLRYLSRVIIQITHSLLSGYM